MNPIQRHFINALRSGQYQEGNLRLRWKDKFTPAGVLADQYLKAMNRPWHEAPWVKDERGRVVWKDPRRHIGVPRIIAAWACIPMEVMVKLEQLNDNGLTYPELADHLEKELKEKEASRLGRRAS